MSSLERLFSKRLSEWPESDNGERARILIVDDLPGNIEVLGNILGDDYDLVIATNGPDALDLAASQPPDLILLDIMMPGMDGFEVCGRLKRTQLACDIPIIFLTASGRPVDEARALEMGAVDFITKPAKPYVVRARVNTQIMLRRQRLELHHFTSHLEELVEMRSGELKTLNRSLQQEVNERKQAEKQLIASNSQLKAIFEMAVDGIITINTSGRIESVNPGLEKIFAYAPDELIGTEAWRLMPRPSSPTDPENPFEQLLKPDTPNFLGRTIETTGVRKDGSAVPLELSVSEVPLANKKLFMGTVRDISARKAAEQALRASEEKLRNLFENTPDHLMVLDRTGKIVFLNRTAPAPFANIQPGDSFLTLFPKALHNRYRTQLEQVFEKGDVEGFISTGDDESWWEFRLAPLQPREGDSPQALVIATDITEKRSLRMQAIHTSRLASIGVLAASVAHEINNPNNSLRFAASSLIRIWEDVQPVLEESQRQNGPLALAGMPLDEADETTRDLLAIIRNNSDRIKNIVAHIKRSGRKDEERLDQPVNIFESLQSAVAILQNEIVRHTDHFDLPDFSGPPLFISGNPQQIEQVWINLFHNALQSLANRKKGVSVTCEIDGPNETIRVVVRDEGVGIPRENLNKVKRPFFTTRQNSDGVGLGLSITNTIIKEHGGRMRLDSLEGRGTTVEVILPLGHEVEPTKGISPTVGR